MTTAFVTGATGFTGREVVRLLAEQGVRTIAHVRPDSPRADWWQGRFRELGAEPDATPWSSDDMAAALRRHAPDLVFFLVGITRAGARREARATGRLATYQSIDLGLAVMLLRAVREADIQPRFVYLSAMGTGPNAASAYGRARHQAEQAVREAGVPFTIARPGLISGPGRDDDRPAERLAEHLLSATTRVASILGARHLARRIAPIDNTTLARALVAAALDPSRAGQVLEAWELVGR